MFLQVENINLCKNLSIGPWVAKNSPKTREVLCFLQSPSPFLPCASLPDKFNLPRKINKFLWCEFKTSKCHGQLILSVSKASLIKMSSIFALSKQPLRWGSKEKGRKTREMFCASVGAPVPAGGLQVPGCLHPPGELCSCQETVVISWELTNLHYLFSEITVKGF